ncbi:MAG: hypothetical protein K8L97_12320 [Anaerolineae bacterium]|nr:hypothetical protein [Anaerolineae bacterium]
MANSRNELALNLILFGQFLLSFILFGAPNLVLYSVTVFAFLFLALLYIYSENDVSAERTKNISKKISSRLAKPVTVGMILDIIINLLAVNLGLPSLEFMSFLLFVVILVILSFACSIVDANLAWRSIKKSSMP